MLRAPILLLVVLALALAAAPTSASFTEYEDQPFLSPGGDEVDDLAGAEEVPFDGTPFLSAFPDGVKLVRGNLDASDIDAYEIFLASGDLLLAALFSSDSGADVDLGLGVVSGGALPLLALDDDDGRGFLARLSHLATGPGAVQVAVTGFGDTAFDGTHEEAPLALADYQLVLAVADDPQAQQESDLLVSQGSNDTLLTADALPASGGVLGASLETDDVDFFAIELEEGDTLFVLVSDLLSGAFESDAGAFNDVVVGLYDPLGVLVTGKLDDDSHQGFLASLRHTIPPGGGGTWKIAVSGFGDAAFDGTHAEGPFDYLFVSARERACPNVTPLMSGLTTSSERTYEVAELEGGDHYYTDRSNAQSHVIVDVPAHLECAEWIKTANNDKDVTAVPHLTFTLAQPAAVYVGYDSRVTTEPTWLVSDLAPFGSVIDIRDPNPTQEFDVFWRHYAAGSVSLGGNEAPGANSNYIVAAKPLADVAPEFSQAIPGGLSGGSISVTVAGEVISVPVGPAATPATLAAALAAAINANAALQSARVFGLGAGDTLYTTAAIQSFDIVAAVPSSQPAVGALLAFVLALLGWRRSRSL